MGQDESHPEYLWWNHELRGWEECFVHLTEPWWASVGAVFEGIRGYWNEDREEIYVFRLDDHLRRLANSMRLLRMSEDEFGFEELHGAVAELVRANGHRGDVYIMPLAYSTGSKAFSRVGERATNLFIYSRPTTSALAEDKTVSVGFSSWTRITERITPPRAKALANYRNSQLASYEAAMNGYDSALLLNTEGKVAEGPGTCVFFVRDGALFTPDLASGILESITRDTVIRLAREVLGLPVAERTVDRSEAYLADEAFMVGTAAEISPISSIDRYEMRQGAPGAVTRQLRELYQGIVRGADPRYPEWRTVVQLAPSEAPSGV